MRLTLVALAAAGTHLWLTPSRRWSLAVPDRATVTAAALGAAVALAAGLHPAIGVAAGSLCRAVPHVSTRIRAGRVAVAARERWPDFLAHVRGRIAAGDPLPDAVRAASRSLGGPFHELDLAWGGSFLTELETIRGRWADPVADRVLTTLRVAATTGGAHVDAVLSALAGSLSQEMHLRAAHDAALTQQRLTAGVALVAPWVMLALTVGSNPQAAAEFATPAGRAILVGGGFATIAGYALARRAARLAQPPRVFS